MPKLFILGFLIMLDRNKASKNNLKNHLPSKWITAFLLTNILTLPQNNARSIAKCPNPVRGCRFPKNLSFDCKNLKFPLIFVAKAPFQFATLLIFHQKYYFSYINFTTKCRKMIDILHNVGYNVSVKIIYLTKTILVLWLNIKIFNTLFKIE